ncbi:hypothetical protein OIO90_001170 [Microbotryomycetes sp. JL221]|nr:hypothetical protein OIO90_001170 [Microbotryomycetes sp. JL221]
MASNGQSSPTSTIYNEDLVRFVIGGQVQRGIVTRCWADEQDPEALAEVEARGLPFTPLSPGQLQVILETGEVIMLQEALVTLEDRLMMPGDFVRTIGSSNGQIGVVKKADVEVRLRHVLSGQVLDGWFDAKDIVRALRISPKDYVVHGNWFGIVEEIFEVAQVQTRNGGTRKLCDWSGALSVGTQSENFFIDRMPVLAAWTATDLQKIVDVQQIVVAVNWLCMRQESSPEQQNSDRPKRYWADLDELYLVRSSGVSGRGDVGDKVVFRNPEADPLVKQTSSDEPFPDGQRVYLVTHSRTQVTVLWQDNTQNVYAATELRPCTDLDDDVDVWPGDIGMYTGVNPPRVAVVQSMNHKQRTIRLKYYDDPNGPEETVSGLEFDHFGPPPQSYGVRQQEDVLVLPEEMASDDVFPALTRLGETEYAIPGQFPEPNELRAEISQLGLQVAQQLPDGQAPKIKWTKEELAPIDWYGYVDELLLDGHVMVQFPSGRKEKLPLTRLYVLDDGTLYDPPDEFMSMMDMSDEETLEHFASGGNVMPGSLDPSGGVWGDDSEWEDADDDESGEEMGGWAEEHEDEKSAHVNGDPQSGPLAKTEAPDSAPKDTVRRTDTEQVVSMPAEVEDHEHWNRFVVLEQAPSDHHFAKEPIVAPSKSFMSRVRKEHNVLATSLPPNILVRAYEDRADLIRCLIIGPLGTPFANAPFLFDMWLPPTRFPAEPPRVFYHAWSGATRISPNLYAEGKVCLSLLNTWHGDKTEPGFEKQHGTKEGKRASDQYNERTLVLTRMFVQRAVQYPPSGFKDEIQAYYKTGLPSTGPGALRGIVEQCKALIEESAAYYERQTDEDEEDDSKRPESSVVPGLLVLTLGASLPLKRTLAILEPLV